MCKLYFIQNVYVHLSSIFIQNTLPSSNGPLLITLKLNGKFRAHMIDIMLTYLKNLKVFIYGIYTNFKIYYHTQFKNPILRSASHSHIRS